LYVQKDRGRYGCRPVRNSGNCLFIDAQPGGECNIADDADAGKNTKTEEVSKDLADTRAEPNRRKVAFDPHGPQTKGDINDKKQFSYLRTFAGDDIGDHR